MKSKLLISVMLIAAVAFTGCSRRGASTTQVGTATGGVVGAGVGAIIGSQTGDAVGGTAIGALAGAGAGAAIGDAIEDKERIIAIQDRAIMKHDQKIAQHQRELEELRALSGDKVQFRGAGYQGGEQMEVGKYSDGLGTSYDGESDIRAQMNKRTAMNDKVYVDPKTLRLPNEVSGNGLTERSLGDTTPYEKRAYEERAYGERVYDTTRPSYNSGQPRAYNSGQQGVAVAVPPVVAKLPEMPLEDFVVDNSVEFKEPAVIEKTVTTKEASIVIEEPEVREEVVQQIEEKRTEDLNQVFNEINSGENSPPAIGAIAVEKTEDSEAFRIVEKSGDTSEECQKAAKESEKGSDAVATADKLFYFRRALRLCPGESSWHVELGKVYASLGRSEDAKFEYEEALRLSPGLPGAMAGLQSVENGTY